jgi:hypothetical protein
MSQQLIKELTPEQEQMISVYRELGLEMGLATGPAVREKAIEGMSKLYKYIGKPTPSAFIFVRSPFEAQVVMNELTINDPGEIKLSNWTLESNDQWVKNLIEKPSNTDRYQFFATHNYGYGSNEAFWVAFYKYFKEVCNVEYVEKSNNGLDIFETLAHNSGWHYMFNECAIICDRASEIHIEQNVLHNDEGPAIAYADDVKIFAIGGHIVTEQIVMFPETITLDQIDNEADQETKRIMIQRYGVAKYLTETGAKVIDSDRLNLEGSSMRTLMEDNKGHRWLIGTDGSTGRVYYMSAPIDANTCKEAHEAMGGISEENLIGEC